MKNLDSTKKLVNLHMKQLCEKIGARPTGSDTNQAATGYAAEVFRQLGFRVAIQEFPCMDWNNEGAWLTVGGMEVDAVAADYSMPCDVTGELVGVSTIEELRHAELRGKICLMYGAPCKETLMPKSMVFWNPDEHKEIIRELELKMPLAVITVSYLPDVPVSIIQDGDFDIPCAVVKGELLDVLLKNQENGEATLKLRTERRPTSGANVIACYGTGKKVSFSAHIDTKPNTPGALDDGSGVAVLLALAAKVADGHYPYQLEFALFNGEDYYSNPGEMLYMQTYLQNPGDYVCAFNVDGVGMMDSTISYSFYECPDEFENRIRTFAAAGDGENGDFEEIEPWPMGDHMIYAGAGIPAVAIASTKIFTLMETVMHTPADNLKIVDCERLEQTVEFLFGCI